MEQYFCAKGIMDDAAKVNTVVIYFIDVALLWWHRKSTDVRYEEFQREFKTQFYPEYTKDEAWEKLHWLTQQGTAREYLWEFSELMLQILDMGEKETFFFLHGWIEAMGEARVTMPRSSRAYKAMNLGPKKYKLESSKPKFKPRGNGAGDKDKPTKNCDGKAQKPWEKNKRWPLTCFHCDSLHMVRDCLKKAVLSTMEGDDGVTKNLGSILGGVEDKASHGLMFVDIIMAGRKLNALDDIGVSDLFMSTETLLDLGLKIEKELGWIKMVNSKSVEIEGVAKGVELQLGDWTGEDTIKIISLDDFDFVIGLNFLNRINDNIFLLAITW
ncbi:reverse transcriptase [Gossypium australe]|uniref:Reverse transcriptase n=1 Tax=Gossypium australe TaxID=47621 RepID=A0A5B6VPN9_9ROSI|nr:reverse transcriptase [Gossypium australe]